MFDFACGFDLICDVMWFSFAFGLDLGLVCCRFLFVLVACALYLCMFVYSSGICCCWFALLCVLSWFVVWLWLVCFC